MTESKAMIEIFVYTNSKGSWEQTLLLQGVKVNEWGGLLGECSRKALVSKWGPEWGLRDYLEDYSQPSPMSDHPRYNSLSTERQPVHNIVSGKWEDESTKLCTSCIKDCCEIPLLFDKLKNSNIALLCEILFLC